MRLAAAFFGSKGQFISEETAFDGTSVILSSSKEWGYFQPYPEEQRPDDGNWHKMPRGKRKLSEPQNLQYKVTISESEVKVSLEIHIEGTEHVPVSCELSFRPGGELSGVSADKNMEDAYYLGDGMGAYKQGEDCITFGPGKTSHKWAQMRGMLPKQKRNSVYITGYTPIKHVIEIS